jgi:hypothetical protein
MGQRVVIKALQRLQRGDDRLWNLHFITWRRIDINPPDDNQPIRVYALRLFSLSAIDGPSPNLSLSPDESFQPLEPLGQGRTHAAPRRVSGTTLEGFRAASSSAIFASTSPTSMHWRG